MSRHRDVRNRAYSYEEDYDYDDEDSYEPNSPNSNEFMYRRDSPSRTQSVFSFVDQSAARESDAVDDGEIIEAAMPFVKAAVGTKFTDAQIAEELRRSNYDSDRTVVSLLERAKTTATTRLQLPVQIAVPRLDDVAKALENKAKPQAKSVTTAIGGGASAPPPPARAKTVEPTLTEDAERATVPQVTTVSSALPSFSPAELKTFAKAEDKAQAACVALAEKEAGKPMLNMVVIGHVDAGKSTITGHLLYKLGYVSQRLMHKFEKESREAGKASFAYAWVMDADDEERARGVTMDVGTSYFETPSKRVTLLDAPGHKDFIPKMIAGASQADVAVLVVPAVTGEFEAAFENSGQTKEHTLLVRSLGVTQLVVAVNKMDAVGWDQTRFDAIVASLSLFLTKAGFRPKNLTFVPVSGITGANLHAKIPGDECKWYQGPTLLDAVDQLAPPVREINKSFRMCVSDVAKSMSLGQTISGRVYAGAASVGDTLLLMPVGLTLTIKGAELNGKSVTHLRAGDTVELGVTGVDPAALSTGSILCSVVAPVRLVRKFEAKILTMPSVEVPLVKGTCATIHVHHVDEPVHLTRLVSQLNSSGEVEKKKPRCLTRDKSAVVQIVCARPICLESFAAFRQLGRFTLRDRGATLAAGIITEILG